MGKSKILVATAPWGLCNETTKKEGVFSLNSVLNILPCLTKHYLQTIKDSSLKFSGPTHCIQNSFFLAKIRSLVPTLAKQDASENH